MSKCRECDGTGYTDGTPDRFRYARCPICDCKECGFSPCQCGIKCQYCKKDVYSFGEKESRMCAACFGLE